MLNEKFLQIITCNSHTTQGLTLLWNINHILKMAYLEIAKLNWNILIMSFKMMIRSDKLTYIMGF